VHTTGQGTQKKGQKEKDDTQHRLQRENIFFSTYIKNTGKRRHTPWITKTKHFFFFFFNTYQEYWNSQNSKDGWLTLKNADLGPAIVAPGSIRPHLPKYKTKSGNFFNWDNYNDMIQIKVVGTVSTHVHDRYR
jgi:hypothetical protein